MAKAKALLVEAGFGPAKPLTFAFRYNTSEVQKNVAAAAAAMWKIIGAQAELVNSDLNTLNADLRNGDYQAARYQWFAEVSDPQSFLYLLESASVGDNHSKYGNPEYDAVMRKVYATADAGARIALMEQAEAIALRDAPITPINYYVSKRLVKPFVKGLEDNVRGINLSRYVRVDRPGK